MAAVREGGRGANGGGAGASSENRKGGQEKRVPECSESAAAGGRLGPWILGLFGLGLGQDAGTEYDLEFLTTGIDLDPRSTIFFTKIYTTEK